jgi:transcription elongation factor GreA
MSAITRDSFNDIEAQLKVLKDRKKATVVRLALAREQGDLKENADYHSAKEELSLITWRLDELNSYLANSTIIDKIIDDGTIRLGTIFSLQDSDNLIEIFKLSGTKDSGQNNISVESPMGLALLGKKTE